MPKNVRHVLLPPTDDEQRGIGMGLGRFIKRVLTRGDETLAERKRLLARRERRRNTRRALVFMSSAERALRLQERLDKLQLANASVHGSTAPRAGEPPWGRTTTFRDRQRALRDLDEGRLRVLIATEMLSRGVDIRGATHVINASVPHTLADYIHRAGRVGRIASRESLRKGGRRGTVITLPATQEEYRRVQGWGTQLGIVLEDTIESPEEDDEKDVETREGDDATAVGTSGELGAQSFDTDNGRQ